MDSTNRAERVTRVARTRCSAGEVRAAASLFGILFIGFAGCDRSAAPVAATTPNAAVMLQRGLQFLESGSNEKAVAAFTESLRLKADDADAHYNRGLAHVRLGNFEAARADYTEAIKLRPDFSDAYTNRSVTFAHRGRLDEAIADCTKSIQLNPNNALAFRNRGLSYHEQAKYELGLADFNEALRLDSGLAEAYFNRANTYLKMQRNDLAAVDFAEAYRLDNSLAVPNEYRKQSATAQGPAAPPPISAATVPQPTPLPTPSEAPLVATEAKSDEQSAFEVVADVYKAEGYTVVHAPESQANDLICTKANQSVHVKVKTVLDPDNPVHFAKTEVDAFSDKSKRTDLVITCAQTSEANAAGPEAMPRMRIVKRLVDWKPRVEELKPVEFEYVPEK